MSKRLNIRTKYVHKIPKGNLRYQVIFNFTLWRPNENNNELYNDIVSHLSELSTGGWKVPRALPSGFRQMSKRSRRKFINNPKSICCLFLESEIDLMILKLSHSHEIKNIYHLELYS